MHFLPSTTALLALLPALVTARIDVDPIPDDLSVGDQYRVHWSSDADYVRPFHPSNQKTRPDDTTDTSGPQILELKLVQKEPDGWIPVKDIFDNREGPAGEHSYLWTVPNVDSCE